MVDESASSGSGIGDEGHEVADPIVGLGETASDAMGADRDLGLADSPEYTSTTPGGRDVQRQTENLGAVVDIGNLNTQLTVRIEEV